MAIRKSSSRRWFAAAGLAGAVAIWIGATQQAFGLAAAGVGALAGMMVSRFAANKTSSISISDKVANLPSAERWRVFGVTGAIAAIIFYLIEYAPGPFEMRLEVNHPIYAFGFLLGGEFLCRAQRLLFSGTKRRPADLLIALASALGLLGIMIAVLFGPSEWHTMRQPFMQRVHKEIAEFQPITLTPGPAWLLTLGTPMFLVGAAFWRALGRDRPMRDRIALMVCSLPCAVAIVLSFVQLRWAGIVGASSAAVAWILFSDLGAARDSLAQSEMVPETGARLPSFSFLHSACILLSLGLVTGWNLLYNRDDAQQVRAQVVDRLATMEVASVLQTNSKTPNPIAIFSGQKERQAWINYVTGVRSVGSLYWDSPSGIRDEAEFLATYDEEAAHRIARARGLNYVVVGPNGGDVVAYHYMWQGNKNAPRIRQTLAYRLAAPHPSPPDWLQILPSSTPAIFSEDIRVYRVL